MRPKFIWIPKCLRSIKEKKNIENKRKTAVRHSHHTFTPTD